MGPTGPVPPGRPSLARRLSLGDATFHGLTLAAALVVVSILGALLVVLYQNSELSIRTFGASFLWSTGWNPPTTSHTPEQYSALPFIYGTLVSSAIAMLLGVPVSLGVAVFLTELSPRLLRGPMASFVELLAAVPSVIYGLWGFFVLVPVMKQTVEPPLKAAFSNPVASAIGLNQLFSGTPFGVDKLSAGVILAIMIIPTVSSISREAFMAVPQSQREAALSLGATRWETTRVGVLAYARTGIFGAITLGLGRAIGETMAVTMTIGNSDIITGSLIQPGQTIASKIANTFGEASPGTLLLSSLLELALVLLVISFSVNVLARLLIGKALNVEEARE